MFDFFDDGVAIFHVELSDGRVGFTGKREECVRYAAVRNERRGRYAAYEPTHRKRLHQPPRVGPPVRHRKALEGG